MLAFIVYGIIWIALLITVCLFIHAKNPAWSYLIPAVFAIIGILLVFVSLLVGGWTGIWLGMIGSTIFIGSAAALLLIAIILYVKNTSNL